MNNILKKIIIKIIKTYQSILSPLFGQQCRFYPSCSQYMINQLNKDGLFWGSIKGGIRILKCNPYFAGGIDEG